MLRWRMQERRGVKGQEFMQEPLFDKCKPAPVHCQTWFEMMKLNAGFVYVWRTFGISLCGGKQGGPSLRIGLTANA